MADKFNGVWKIRKGRAILNNDFVTVDIDITVAPYEGSSFTFRMKIDDSTYVDFPATDATDRFTIGPYTHNGRIYEGDVWRVVLFYDDNGVETLLNGVIKRRDPDGLPTDPDTVSFTAIKTGN